MTRKQQRIILVLVAAATLTTAMACTFCCPFASNVNIVPATPAASAPTQPPGAEPTKAGVQPTKAPEPTKAGVQPTKAPEPTKAGVQPTKAPEPTKAGAQPTPLPLGSTTVQSFRFMADMQTGDKTSKVEGEKTATAMHLKLTEIEADGTKREQEMYYVGEYMYMKEEGGTEWTKLQVGAISSEMLNTFDFNTLLKESQDKGELNLKLIGPAVVRGVACMKYEFINKDPEAKGQGFAFLGIADGLLYRIEGESTNEQGVTSKVVWESWDYNKDFTIEPPIK